MIYQITSYPDLKFLSLKKILIFLSLYIFCILHIQGQGAIDGFMKNKSETDVAFTYSFEFYNKYYFGTEIQDISVNTQTASLFIAHGFNNNLNMIVSIPYMWNGANSNFQDAIIALKYRGKKIDFDRGSLSRISSFGFSFPISGYEVDIEKPIGQRATAFQLRHLYQYQIGGFFIHLQSGFDFRIIPSSQFSVPVICRTGFAHAKFYLDAWIDYFHTINAGVDQNISAGEGSRFLKIGGTLYYPITLKLGVFIGGAHFLSGQNIGKASRINLGFVLRRF